MALYVVMMTSEISSICRTLPSEIVQNIKAYMPRDRDMSSPTARCIRQAKYKYGEHKFWNYHVWLLSFQEFVLSDFLRTSPYSFAHLSQTMREGQTMRDVQIMRSHYILG